MQRHPAVNLLVRWGINALGIFVAAWIIPGIDYRNNTALFIVVVVLGLFNAFLKPLLVLFALPFVVLTLGVGILFINALLLMLAAWLVDGFEVTGFFPAFLGALIISVLNLLLGGLAGDTSVTLRRRGPHAHAPRPRGRDDDVIDI
jgi:putative membrane protein